jgi:hypothetical protein
MSTVESNLVEDANLVQMNDETQVPREDVVGREHELIIEPGRNAAFAGLEAPGRGACAREMERGWARSRVATWQSMARKQPYNGCTNRGGSRPTAQALVSGRCRKYLAAPFAAEAR